jgi:cell division septation protein DedD
MAKFEQKLQELGLQESELSVACKNLINDYREGINYIETLGENEGGELDVDIEDLQNELEMLDDKIVEKIQWFFDNRELVEKRKENLKKRGRPSKKDATANATPSATPTPTPTPTATPTPNPTPNVADQPKKKGIGFGTILLLLGGTILGVSLLKNRN